MKYLRYFILKYSEKKLLHFVSLVILVSSLAEYDFAQILLFVDLWEKLKSEPSCVAAFNPTLLLAPREQLLALSSTHDFPAFLFLEVFPAAVILEDVGV